MKRLVILLTVCTLVLAGCSGGKEQTVTDGQGMETASKPEETQEAEALATEDMDMETEKPKEPENDNEPQKSAKEEKEGAESASETEKPRQSGEQDKKTASSEEKKKEVSVDKDTSASASTEKKPEKEPKAETQQEPETVAYDPYQVVSLATDKTKAYGKISIPEDLDMMLANGEITKAEYDEYYPYDGAGYYSVFVETDLNQAATTSGRKLGSVEGIADYIAEMLSLETVPYFYIEYAGIYSQKGTDFYEFRCYRA